MTIQEAINKIDTLKPNSYSNADKIAWLSNLDGIIKEEIIDTHEGGEMGLNITAAVANWASDRIYFATDAENIGKQVTISFTAYTRSGKEITAEVTDTIVYYESAPDPFYGFMSGFYNDPFDEGKSVTINYASVVFNGYDSTTDTRTALLVPAPYDDLYIKWLEAQIDYTNAEYGKYNNSSNAYNNAYSTYERYYNRHHMPLAHKLKFF